MKQWAWIRKSGFQSNTNRRWEQMEFTQPPRKYVCYLSKQIFITEKWTPFWDHFECIISIYTGKKSNNSLFSNAPVRRRFQTHLRRKSDLKLSSFSPSDISFLLYASFAHRPPYFNVSIIWNVTQQSDLLKCVVFFLVGLAVFRIHSWIVWVTKRQSTLTLATIVLLTREFFFKKICICYERKIKKNERTVCVTWRTAWSGQKLVSTSQIT